MDVAIDQDFPSRTLLKLARAASKHALTAYGLHQTPETVALVHLCESVRYFYHGNMLWDQEQYGASLYTFNNYVHAIATDTWPHIKEELDRVPILLNERTAVNNSVYYDLEVDPGLDTPVTLLNNSTDDTPVESLPTE